MLFRPSFCANCGEKIERNEWRLWTSRRFCVVCESEFKGQDLVVRSIGILAVVVGVFGFGAYLTSSNAGSLSSPNMLPRSVVSGSSSNKVIATSKKPDGSTLTDDQTPVQTNTNIQQESATSPANREYKERPIDKTPVQENQATYFCGAETKKGTPCSRRVKGNVRCFQHAGMPAMLPAAKLKIS